jgi:shikimate 5-dehydrogenase
MARTLIDNYLRRLNKIETIMIYGTGGLSKAVQYACKSMGISCVVFTRGEIEKLFDLRNTFVFNCTPVTGLGERISNTNMFIDCIIGTPTGNELANIQAEHQWNLYTKGYEHEVS